MANPRITWRLGVDDQVTGAIKGIDSRIAGLTKSFKTFAGLAGFAAIAAGLTRLAGGVVDLADELGDASAKFGVSVEALNRLKVAAETTGGSFDQLQTAFAFLARRGQDAGRGMREAQLAFEFLGLDAQKLSALALDKQFALIARQLQQLPPGAQQTAAAMGVLGRGASDLLPLMQDLDGELGKVSTTMSEEHVQSIKDATDAWTRLKNTLTVAVAPAVAEVLTRLNEIPAGFRALVGPIEREIGRLQGKAFGGTGATAKWGPSEEEAAAIMGVPGRKSIDQVKALLQKGLDEFAGILADQRAKAAKAVADAATADMAAIIERTRTPFENYRAGVERVTELHERWGLSTEATNRELERLGALLGAETQALVDATSAGQQWNRDHEDAADIIASLISPMDQLAERYRRIGELQAKGLLTPGQAGAAREDEVGKFIGDTDRMVEAASERTTRLLEEIRNASSGFARDLTQIMFNTTESIGDMFNRLGQRIAEAFIEIKLVQPLIDSILGSFGGSVSEIDLSGFNAKWGKRALGGPVMGGRSYLVGEQGPELFVPRQAGQIVPSGAGEAPVVNINIQATDAAGFDALLVRRSPLLERMVQNAFERRGKRGLK